ncbi:MAG: cold shock domain-containing protein [Bacteroidota bacterium]|nr:cold shock domain-containing protein [Flavisolibacter sp.]MBD0294478.1 cold shock domain-containing protein [Flavisolibacter sp.]MBD0352178.1 cold shock domain-containing protein [Flavisolibacter sp.]MBD0366789.1 cold shock domain-containing protein [Flavisolibacter sp.]MDQ3843658.1 cold shock domain-containing protein [Bacteroidota bacterium]
MGRPGGTFGKREKELKKEKQRLDKAEKMEERRNNAKKGKTLDEMMAYLDENGNLSTTPPDPRKKKIFNQEDMQISVPKYVPSEENNATRTGVVSFFNQAKGFGFIKDEQSGESAFIHVNQLSVMIQEGDKVNFEVETGPKGLNAINVTKRS